MNKEMEKNIFIACTFIDFTQSYILEEQDDEKRSNV